MTLPAAAILVPDFFPDVSPRWVVRLGTASFAGALVLVAALDADASAEIVAIPLLLIGLGTGAPSSPARVGFRVRSAGSTGCGTRRVDHDRGDDGAALAILAFAPGATEASETEGSVVVLGSRSSPAVQPPPAPCGSTGRSHPAPGPESD
ncbi:MULTISPECIES: hypothetical protein [unclassified Streptomyces]|uniref:hypothetical protein n=2 Tax=Streptomyces TaxID=1883 RepID=UPI0038173B54